MYTIPTEEYPEDWLLYDIFNILAIMIPFYSAYQEQKVTETKGKKNLCRFSLYVQHQIHRNCSQPCSYIITLFFMILLKSYKKVYDRLQNLNGTARIEE